MPSCKRRHVKEGFGVICQDCGLPFQQLSHYKQHVQSVEHKKQLETLFNAVPPSGPAGLPHIKVFARVKDPGMAEAPIGLHLVTMCYSSGAIGEPFYLCHTCQEKCSNNVILCHLSSQEHRFSYLASLKPHLLRFGWISCLDAVAALKPGVVGLKDTGPLMLLDMPEKLFHSTKRSPYFHIMKDIFRQKLPEKLQVEKMQKMTLKGYISHEKRTHPMLGLSFLVEYSNREHTWLCGYLCLICQRKIHQSQVVAHLIGFEHVFATLSRVLPSSVGNKADFKQKVAQGSSSVLELAKQAVLLEGCKELQEVKLDRDDFEKVDSLSFKNALDKLQAIRQARNESVLQLPGTLTPHQVPVEDDPLPKPAVDPISTQRKEEPWEALRSFIKGCQRSEPVVGVGAVLQCCAEGRPPFSMCRACAVKVPPAAATAHLTSCEHRYLYLKWQHPNLLSSCKETQDLEEKASYLRTVAQTVEHEEGCGEVQVLDLDVAKYEEVVSQSVSDALNHLQATWRERSLDQNKAETLLNPDLMLVPVKQERGDYSRCSKEPHQGRQNSAMSSGGSEIPTQAYKALWNHLNSKLRRQPVIGLRTLVEYHEDKQMPYFLCETCGTKLPQGFIVGHLISAEHRYKYIKSQHPKLLNGWKEEPDLSEYEDALMAKAKFLEMTEGLGEIQIRKMGKDGFEQVFLPSTEKVKVEPSLIPHSNVTNSSKKDSKAGSVKEECVESCITPPAAASGPTGAVSVKQAPCPSSKMLWDFVKSPNRTEPVVGLSLMMQFFSEGLSPYYMCEPCVLRMSKGCIIRHIISPSHRLAYMKCQHPNLMGCGMGSSLGQDYQTTMKVAKSLEVTEGSGEMKILKLARSQYSKMVLAPVHEALKMLQAAWNQQCELVSVDQQNHEQTPGAATRTLPRASPPGPSTFASQAAPQTSTQSSKNKDAWPYSTPCPTATPSIFSSKYSHVKAATIRGLSAVIECQPTKGCPFYVCKCCSAKLVSGEVFNHVNSMAHRCAYMKDRYSVVVSKCDARALKAEGPGAMLVMKLDFPDYQRVFRMAAKEALDELQLIWKKLFQRNRQSSGTTQAENKGFPSQTPQSPVQDMKSLVIGEPTPCPPAPTGELPAPPPTAAGELTDPPLAKQQIKQSAVKELSPIPHVEALVPNVPIGERVSPEVPTPMPGEALQRRMMLPPPALDPQLLQIKAAAADETHLSKFLLPFRCNKEQPVIGLQKVLECRSFKQPTLYLCLCCGEKVDNVRICRHVTGGHHQYSYMRAEHPYLLQSLGDSPDVDSKAGLLMKLAEVVEYQEGAGQAQVMKLDPVLYQEVAAAEFHTALEKLNVSREHTREACIVSTRDSMQGVAGDVSVQSPAKPSTAGGSPQGPNGGGFNYSDQSSLVLSPHTLAEGQNADRDWHGDAAEDRSDRVTVRGLEQEVAAMEEDSTVVGLQVVTECHCVDNESRPYIYLCQVCSLKLEEDSVLEHICSSLHHYHYITSRRSWALEAEKKVKKSLFGISDLLKLAAVRLRQSEGHGEVQVVHLPEVVFNRLVEGNYELCMTMVKGRNVSAAPGDSTPTEQDTGVQVMGALTRLPGGVASVVAPDPPVQQRSPAGGAVVEPLKVSVTQSPLDPSSSPFADRPSCESSPSPRCSDIPADLAPPTPCSVTTVVRFKAETREGQTDVTQDCCNAISGVSRSGSYGNLSSALPGCSCSATDGSATSKVEPGQCGCGPHRWTVPHDIPIEDSQKIKDLILELILHKQMIDKELSGNIQKPQGIRTVEMGCPGDRTAGDGPLGTVSTLCHVARHGTFSRAPKRKCPEDDSDPFSYENRQFAAGAPLQDHGHSVKRQFRDSAVQQNLRTTENVELGLQPGLADPHVSPCCTVPKRHSAVSASTLAAMTQQSHLKMDLGPPVVETAGGQNEDPGDSAH